MALVVNALTHDSRAALIDGYGDAHMAIATPLPGLCRDLFEMMIRATREADEGVSGQYYFLEPRVFLPDIV